MLPLFQKTRPAPNHYFPSLHQLKYEVENGITPNARLVRFGYDPRAFPGFSWRGYAIMSPAQVSQAVACNLKILQWKSEEKVLLWRYLSNINEEEQNRSEEHNGGP